MKLLKLFKISFLLISIFYLVSCADYEFNPDPTDPRIPIYSDEGKNTAGAYINDKIWNVKGGLHIDIYTKNNDNELNDTLDIVYKGEILENNEDLNIHFLLTNEKEIQTFNDLEKLEGKVIDIDGITTKVYVNRDINSDNQFVNGKLFIRRAERIVKRTKDNDTGNYKYKIYLVFSGTFGFEIEYSDGEKINVRSARFDFLLDEEESFNDIKSFF